MPRDLPRGLEVAASILVECNAGCAEGVIADVGAQACGAHAARRTNATRQTNTGPGMSAGPAQAKSIGAIEQQYPQCVRAIPGPDVSVKAQIPLGAVSLGVIITQLSR